MSGTVYVSLCDVTIKLYVDGHCLLPAHYDAVSATVPLVAFEWNGMRYSSSVHKVVEKA
jgi:hypothetical protein